MPWRQGRKRIEAGWKPNNKASLRGATVLSWQYHNITITLQSPSHLLRLDALLPDSQRDHLGLLLYVVHATIQHLVAYVLSGLQTAIALSGVQIQALSHQTFSICPLVLPSSQRHCVLKQNLALTTV